MTTWINTISRTHVLRGVAGGFTQANHGNPGLLRRLRREDWIAFYSPRTDYPEGEPLRAFTADDLSFPIENIDDIEFLED